MPKDGLVKCKCCGHRIPPNPNLPKEQRIALYTGHLAQGKGCKLIHRATGIPVSTVKLDLKQLREAGASLDPPASSRGNGPAPAPGLAPPGGAGAPAASPKGAKPFDWHANMDKLGQVLMGLFAQAVQGWLKCEKCGHPNRVAKDTDAAMKWLDRFQRLYSAKMGGIKIAMFSGNGKGSAEDDLPPTARILAVIKRLNRGRKTCIACGQGLDEGAGVVDAQYKVIEQEEK